MVRYFTPNSTEAVITRRRFSVPALCPASRGKPRESAQRPLPSMIMATWRGILSRGTLIGVSVITIIRHCELRLGATWQSLINTLEVKSLHKKQGFFIMYINQNSQRLSFILNAWQVVLDVRSAKEFSIFVTQLFLD